MEDMHIFMVCTHTKQITVLTYRLRAIEFKYAYSKNSVMHMKGKRAMHIKLITENKKDFMDLLLLADEQEDMIMRYLDRGDLFALYDDDLKSVCVVTDEGDGAYELQNLATYAQYQGKGYGSSIVNHALAYYKGKGAVMYVGTGDCPATVNFYEHRGFTFSHRLKNYILEHYKEPIFENGVQLIDKVYFKQGL